MTVCKRTAVLGASPKPERYSNKAIRMLRDYGHEVVPVNPGHKEIEGLKVAEDVTKISGAVDTVTLYMNAEASAKLADPIIALKPKRVIFNPGAESPPLKVKLEAAGIECVEACTLVMLSTDQF